MHIEVQKISVKTFFSKLMLSLIADKLMNFDSRSVSSISLIAVAKKDFNIVNNSIKKDPLLFSPQNSNTLNFN